MKDFYELPDERVKFETENFFVVEDGFPVSPGHCLIISKEVKISYFDLSEEERYELSNVIFLVKEHIENSYQPDGYNVGMNCGELAGQTVMHFHCHIIPRYLGDMDNPRGGIRHCIDGKGYY